MGHVGGGGVHRVGCKRQDRKPKKGSLEHVFFHEDSEY